MPSLAPNHWLLCPTFVSWYAVSEGDTKKKEHGPEHETRQKQIVDLVSILMPKVLEYTTLQTIWEKSTEALRFPEDPYMPRTNAAVTSASEPVLLTHRHADSYSEPTPGPYALFRSDAHVKLAPL